MKPRNSLATIFAWAMLLSGSAIGLAKADDASQIPAAEPTLAAMIPAGVMRGSTVTAIIDGANLGTVNSVRVSGKGVTAEIAPPASNRAATTRQITIQLTATSEAELGLRELRLVTPSGTSNVIRFAVGAFPETTEAEPNDTPALAMRLDQLPIVVNGAINRNEDRDCFRFTAKKGQQLVFDLLGQRLHPYVGNQRPGWLEGLLTIREANDISIAADALLAAEKDVAEKLAKSKAATAAVTSAQSAAKKIADQKSEAAKTANDKVVAAQQAAQQAAADLATANLTVAQRKSEVAKLSDQRFRNLAVSQDFGGREDPLLVFTAPNDGQYVVEVRDDLYRSRPEYNYRLTIGEIPLVTSVFPAGGQRGTTLPLTMEGFNLRDTTKLSLPVAADLASSRLRLEQTNAAIVASTDAVLEIGDDPELLEIEPNDSAVHATATSVPVVLNGIIERDGDFDFYRFRASKGERLIFECVSRTLGSPLDAKLDLFDMQGRRLKEADDINNNADALLDHTFSADGEYVVRVGDTTDLGSRRHVYRLKIRAPRPDFSLTVTPDSPRVTAGGSTAVRVIAQRRDGFTGDIDISFPKAPSGITISPATIGAGQTETTVSLTASKEVAHGPIGLTVIGKAKIGDADVQHEATIAEQFRINNNWRYVPVGDLVLSVIPQAPLTLEWEQTEVKLVAGETIKVPLKVHRAEGITQSVRIVLEGLPARISAPPVVIDENATSGTIEIRSVSGVPAGVANTVANGTISVQGKTFVQTSPALRLQLEAATKK